MYFVTLIFKNLLRRKTRTLLTIFGMAIAVGTMVAFVGVARGFERSAFDTFHKRGEDIVIVAAGVPNQLSSNLDIKIAKKIETIPGVRLVTPGLVEIISFRSYYALVQGWEANNPAFNDFEILSGRLFTPNDRQVALLGSNVASHLKKKVGDTIPMKGKDFKVIGIFQSFSLYDNGSVITKLEDLQNLLGRKNSVTGFSVVLQDALNKKETIATVVKAINALKDEKGNDYGLSALPTSEYISQSIHVRMVHAMAWLTTVIALLMGTVSMANTMAMSVVERMQEIGILRALGWRKWRVVRMILGESLVLSLVGGAIGSLGAFIACLSFPSLPQVGNFIEGKIELPVIAEGLLLTIFVGLIGGAWPCMRAAYLLPTKAIYHE
jgi:putative ABC transport system permease protein